MKIISSVKSKNPNFSNDLQIELSLIKSGLVITEAGNSVIFIIKDSDQIIKGLANLKSAFLNFTTIDRLEFPTINTRLKLKTDENISVKYDYFFNSDSEYELNLLQSILNQNYISLYFLTDITEKRVKVEMEKSEIDQLENCLREI